MSIDSFDPDVLQDFLAESAELLDETERLLDALDRDPRDRGAIDGAFRALHTIKGNASFLSFDPIVETSHAAESALDRARSDEASIEPTMLELLRRAAGRLRDDLDRAETGQPPVPADDDLLRRLAELGGQAATPAPSNEEIDVVFRHLDTRLEGHLDAQPSRPGDGSDNPDAPGADPQPADRVAAAPRTVRLDPRLLDDLFELTLEVDRHAEPERASLRRLAAEMRLIIREARRQPIGTLFARYPRLIDELARRTGKPIRLETDGDALLVESRLIGAIRDPLVHMLRNCADHGIEPTDQRTAAGKPECGTIRLAASIEEDSLVVRVADDGRGLDREAILTRALERGLIAPDRAAALRPGEIEQLIFAPGFSTAQAVTELSGRGVGMDIVRASIESAGGTIEIDSTPGRGTEFTVRLPLPRPSVPSLIVGVGRSRLAFALHELLEVARLDDDAVLSAKGQTLWARHNGPVPLIEPAEVLGLDVGLDRPSRYVVVIRNQGCPVALAVDELLDQQEIVIKPASDLFDPTGPIIGTASIRGGGAAMVVDTARLAGTAGIAHHAGAAPLSSDPMRGPS